MADIADRLEAEFAVPQTPAPQQPAGDIASRLEAEFGGGVDTPTAPTSAVPPAGFRGFGVAGGVMNLGDWVEKHPKEAAHMLIQGGIAGAGSFAGSAGGPPGMVAMGGLGNLAGDIAARALLSGGKETPTLEEGAIDLAAGSIPSLAMPLLRGGAAALGRTLTNTRGAVGQKELLDQSGDLAAAAVREAQDTGIVQSGGILSTERLADSASVAAAPVTRASRIAAGAASPTRSVGPVGVIMELLSGNADPARMAGWLAAGAALPPVQEAAIKRLLMNPKVVDSIRSTVRELITTDLDAGQIAARVFANTLLPAAQQYARTPADQRALSELTTEPDNSLTGRRRRAERNNPFASLLKETPWGHRDTVSGRFASAPTTGEE